MNRLFLRQKNYIFYILSLLFVAFLLSAGGYFLGGHAAYETKFDSIDREARTPQPSTLCKHAEWEDGVCVRCGLVCTHAFDAGVCRVCGYVCPHDAHDPDSAVCLACGLQHHHYEEHICTGCGREPLFYDEVLPDYYYQPVEHQGSYVEGHYRFRGFDQTVAIWLPYDYNEETLYNVVVLIPGDNGYAPNFVITPLPTKQGTIIMRNVYDHMVEEHLCDPFIIVGVNTFGLDTLDSSYGAAQFHEGLFPYLAENYSTWAQDGSYESLVAAREHFSIGGMSRGSVLAYHLGLRYCLDLAANFCCFSNFGNRDWILDAVNSPEIVDYSIHGYFASWGLSEPSDYWRVHRSGYYTLVDQVDRLEDSVNAIGMEMQGGHTWLSWSTALFDAIQWMF